MTSLPIFKIQKEEQISIEEDNKVKVAVASMYALFVYGFWDDKKLKKEKRLLIKNNKITKKIWDQAYSMVANDISSGISEYHE